MVWKLPCERNLPNGTSRYKPTQLLHLIGTVQDFGLASVWDVAHEPAWIPKLKASGRSGSIIHAFIPFDSHLLYSWLFHVPPLSQEEWWGYVRPQHVRQVLDFKFPPFCRQTQAMFVDVYSNPTSNISKHIHKTVECPLLYHLARGRMFYFTNRPAEVGVHVPKDGGDKIHRFHLDVFPMTWRWWSRPLWVKWYVILVTPLKPLGIPKGDPKRSPIESGTVGFKNQHQIGFGESWGFACHDFQLFKGISNTL